MIGYVTVGTNDLPRAAAFYDAIAAEMGVGRMMEFETGIAWGVPEGGAGIAAMAPFDGNPATV
ncbi:MAG: VOC family protein, partial [Novosphingobium sp.]